MSRNPRLYSTRRLVDAAKARGHEVMVLDVLRCYMNITSMRPEMHYKGEKLEGFDAVIPRIGASVTFYGMAVLRQFEMMGVYPLNESVAITRSRDKLRSLQLLSRKGIGLPVTGFANKPDDTQDLIKMVGGAPLVIKPPEERSTAVRAAQTMGLNVAGVDLLRSNHGPVVMEVSSSPGLEGIETATGKDIAGMILAFIERSAALGKTRTRGSG